MIYFKPKIFAPKHPFFKSKSPEGLSWKWVRLNSLILLSLIYCYIHKNLCNICKSDTLWFILMWPALQINFRGMLGTGYHKVMQFCTVVWWQLWNFKVWQMKFNRFFHPNELPQSIFWYLVRVGVSAVATVAWQP